MGTPTQEQTDININKHGQSVNEQVGPPKSPKLPLSLGTESRSERAAGPTRFDLK